MRIKCVSSCLLILMASSISAQNTTFEKISFIIGEWKGTGSGFGNEKSEIVSSFQFVMDHNYIEVKNESTFKSTDKNPEGDYHIETIFDVSFPNQGYTCLGINSLTRIE